MRTRRHRLGVAALSTVGLLAATAPAAIAGVTVRVPLSLHAVPAGCATVAVARFHCFSQLLAEPDGNPHATSAPAGYRPADLASAYRLPSAGGVGHTVAVVDAFDDPNAEADLAVYRAQFGLPACTTANGCFRKVNQSGDAGAYPTPDSGWATEISLDVDMVSATCPACHILLVEANSNSDSDLYSAVDAAARIGATEISNSYGGSESANQITAGDPHFNHPGLPITVSTGDSGYGVQYPAASQYVTAVGGTTLNRSSSARGWSETVWSGTGSGCSAYEPKPSWQHDSGCSFRTVGDVAAVADPNTGVAVYDSYSTPVDGWLTVGGTSASAPLIAAVYALAGNRVTYGSNPYAHTDALYDITSGSNSGGGLLGLGLFACHNYLCTGVPGYDGPTGWGTPNGTGAF